MYVPDEQIAELHEGDVVEARHHDWPEGQVIRGPIRKFYSQLRLAGYQMTSLSGQPWTVTVVSRAPRPLYVNHDRTEPVRGDVVKDADGGSQVWMCDESRDWWSPTDGTVRMWESPFLPKRLRLLVDGTTGQVVP